MTHRVILDCDPGVDDCIALLVALGASDRIELQSICVVAGNVPVDVCARNALGILALAGRGHVPVYSGCERPLRVEPSFAEHIHGRSGLGDATLPAAISTLEPANAVDHLCSAFGAAEPQSITLVITGPMTNFATALQRDPSIKAAVRDVVIMGGASEAGGNITPFAEFNIYADPDAAKTVLESGCRTTLIGLDATLQFRCTPSRMQRLTQADHAASLTSADMIAHVNRVYGEVYGAEGAALHDPCTVGYLLAPELFDTREVAIDVDCSTGDTRGQTRIHAPGEVDGLPVINWVTGVRDTALFDLIVTEMERL
ncbi:nucleoside hydrolase [Maricaulis sp.]|uniref:nucleoside hydrolase n=1 Tax=Maricaulis sp. TaxID=1486257 RepID=UPI002629CB55|nr:nucleoside hydrolase [Maricaulis sp.]